MVVGGRKGGCVKKMKGRRWPFRKEVSAIAARHGTKKAEIYELAAIGKRGRLIAKKKSVRREGEAAGKGHTGHKNPEAASKLEKRQDDWEGLSQHGMGWQTAPEESSTPEKGKIGGNG